MPVSGSHSMAASPPAVRGPHGPGPTSRETSAVPGVKSQFAWVAAMIIAAGTTHLRHIILATAPIGGALEFGYQTIDPRRSHRRPVLGGADDFAPARRLLFVLAAVVNFRPFNIFCRGTLG